VGRLTGGGENKYGSVLPVDLPGRDVLGVGEVDGAAWADPVRALQCHWNLQKTVKGTKLLRW